MRNKATKFESSLFEMSQCVICSPVWRFLCHVIAQLQRAYSDETACIIALEVTRLHEFLGGYIWSETAN